MKRIAFVVFVLVFVTVNPARAEVKLPRLPFMPKDCSGLAADAYAANLKVLNAQSAVQRDVQFFEEHPEMATLLQLSGKKLKAQPPSEEDLKKAEDAEKRMREACKAERDEAVAKAIVKRNAEKAAAASRADAEKTANRPLCESRTDADGPALAALCKELGIAPKPAATAKK